MASFITIPKFLLVHLLLLFLSSPFIHQSHNLAAADSQLIQTECQKSETPETCINCLKPDPGSEKADSIGIATIVLNCINNHAETLEASTRGLASKTKDQKLKTLYQECEKGYKNAKAHLASGKQALQNHSFDKARLSVSGSLSLDTACLIKIMIYKGQVPSDVLNEMKVYEELSEAANKIIETLK